MKLTTKQAKAISLKKWEHIIEDNPEYISCGFCRKYDYQCEECPLQKLWGMGCNALNSPWKKWQYTRRGDVNKLYWAMVIYFDLLSLEV